MESFQSPLHDNRLSSLRQYNLIPARIQDTMCNLGLIDSLMVILASEHQELHVTVVDHSDSLGLFEKCRQIRIEVFVDEQGFALGDEFDDLDRQSIHLLFSLDDHPNDYIGTLRYIPQKQKVGRLALLAAYRGRGLGRQMMESLDRFLVDKYSSIEALLPWPDSLPVSINSHPSRSSVDVALPQKQDSGRSTILLKLHSQIYIMPFYEKLGYQAVGDRFDEDGAPHQLMVKTIQTQKDS